MKRIFTILAALVVSAIVFAQAPEKMSYQAVVRNSSDQLLTNHAVGMQISILLGSSTGTIVYTETQTPSTNANGLINIEIGGGIGFSKINWANGPYFLKTETDPTGSTNYTITGTSQLLTVPYALHAKTAESITGTNTEIDPVYSSSQAANITTNDITKLSNLLGVNTGDQDGSETKVTSGTNVTVTGTGTTISPYVVNSTGVPALAIGDSYQGGRIFWLDASGQHGLIAANAIQGNNIPWWNGAFVQTNAEGDGLYAGAMNTIMIVVCQPEVPGNFVKYFAAQACADYSVTVGDVTYGDWYLPSKYELNLLYLQKEAVGYFNDYYWSSTEVHQSDRVYVQRFSDGYLLEVYENEENIVTRAIRAF